MTIEEAKDELAYYSELDAALREIHERLAQLESSAERCTRAITGRISGTRNPHSLENTWAELAEEESRHMVYKIEIEEIRQSVEERIANLPPEDHYMLFMRHIKGYAIAEIGKKRQLSERTAYRQYAKALALYAAEYEKPALTGYKMRRYLTGRIAVN